MDAIRNLEQIQEKDDATKMPRAVSIALLVLGGACIVLSAMALGGSQASSSQARTDPLGDLVAKQGKTKDRAPDLATRDVTFPGILSDGTKPTTALAALGAASMSVAMPTHPPPPTDVLPVIPIPAQDVLE